MLFPVALLASLVLLQQTPPAAPTSTAATPPVTAQAAAPAPAGPSVVAQQTEPAQVCRTEPVTGSRFGRRVCRSVLQTDEDRANSREMLRQMQGARTPPAG